MKGGAAPSTSPSSSRRRQRGGQGMASITVVPHAPCPGHPEADLVTITTQATPKPLRHQTQDKIVAPVAVILVTDISGGGADANAAPPLPRVPASDAPHTTTTTTTTPHSRAPCLPTSPRVPGHAPALPPASLQYPVRMAGRTGQRARPQGSTLTINTRPAPPLSGCVRQARAVPGDSGHGRGTPHGQPGTGTTSPAPPAPRPGHADEAATHVHPHTPTADGVVAAGSGVAPITNSTSCSFCCKDMSGGGNIFIVVNMKTPLPHSLLEPPALLQCLGVRVPGHPPPPGAAPFTAALCGECHGLLCEADGTYGRLLGVTGSMRQRWGGPEARPPPCLHQQHREQQAAGAAAAVPTTALLRGARMLRRILPKTPSPVPCVLCGAQLGGMEAWQLHASNHHKLSRMWRNPLLQAILKVRLAMQQQQQGPRPCPGCGRHFAGQEFVDHLRGHHSIVVEEGLLACGGGGAEQGRAGQGGAGQGGAEQGGAGQRPGGAAGWLRQEEEEEVKDEIEEEEEIMENEEDIIEEEGRIMKDEDWEEEEQGMEEEEDVDEVRRSGDSLVEQPAQPGVEESGQESGSEGPGATQGPGVGEGRRGEGRWRCRVCAATFASQRGHDSHKAAAHPGSVRARRGRTPPAPHTPCRRGAAPGQQDRARPAAACQEGAIVILEGDGRGGVTHRRLQPAAATEVPRGEGGQDAPPRTAGASGFPCPACAEVLGDRPALVRHRRAAHPGPGEEGSGEGQVLVECPLCGRRLAGPPALHHHLARVHRRPAHPPLRHRCRLCLAHCRTRPQLERHMRECHGAPPPPPPVRCGCCGKSYSARYIDSHLANMHGDAARFPCTFCPMKYGTRAGLRAHVSLEHANTSWACQQCPMQFAKYHQLRQHRLYVHSLAEHRCPECPRAFKRRCDLTEHAKRRHRQRQPSQCSFCPKAYSDRKRLRTHLMRKHGVAWEETLAATYATRQRQNNCLRRRRQQQQQPRSPRPPPGPEQHPPREEGEGGTGHQEYSVVHLSEEPHPLPDTISYIILEEA